MRRFLKPLAAKLARLAGAHSSVPASLFEVGRPDVDAADRAILFKVRPFTMTSEERVVALLDAVRYLSRYDLQGAFVECGVWRGGSSMAAALALQAIGNTSRDLYLYDTFDGMSAPTEIDRVHSGQSAADQLQATQLGTGIWCRAGLDEVQANLASTGYPADRIRYVRGRVEDTIPATLPDMIALLRLDTDWYESTKHELEHLYPRLVPGGVLIIDDYGHWQGARKAVDEYFARLPTPVFLHRIDYTGRCVVKLLP
jgi:hypothetical protein